MLNVSNIKPGDTQVRLRDADQHRRHRRCLQVAAANLVAHGANGGNLRQPPTSRSRLRHRRHPAQQVPARWPTGHRQRSARARGRDAFYASRHLAQRHDRRRQPLQGLGVTLDFNWESSPSNLGPSPFLRHALPPGTSPPRDPRDRRRARPRRPRDHLPGPDRDARCRRSSATSAMCSSATRWSRRSSAARSSSTGRPDPRATVDDVITYVPPGPRTRSTHRIVRREAVSPTAARLPHQGRQQPREDLWPFTLDRPTQARFAFASPTPATSSSARRPTARMLLLVAPRAAIALLSLAGSGASPAVLLEQRDEVGSPSRSRCWPARASPLTRTSTHAGNTATVTAASPTQYFHIYSKATLPPPDAAAGCSSTRRGAAATPRCPPRAARSHLSVHMGGWRSQDGALDALLTAIRAPSTFPDGVTRSPCTAGAARPGDGPVAAHRSAASSA